MSLFLDLARTTLIRGGMDGMENVGETLGADEGSAFLEMG